MRDMSIKPIETRYNGYRFRSRLEARWAVFFDALGIAYEYEPDGFVVDGKAYLVDFYLPKFSAWTEVKPTNPTPEEQGKVAGLVRRSDSIGIILIGTPNDGSPNRPEHHWGYAHDFSNSGCGFSDHAVRWAVCPRCREIKPSFGDENQLVSGAISFDLLSLCSCGYGRWTMTTNAHAEITFAAERARSERFGVR